MIYDVLAIGNPVYDVIITPLVKSKGRILSGCSVNALLTLRRLGFKKLALVGSLGKDFMNRFRREIREYGIMNFTIITSMETGGFELIYDDKGNRELHILGIAGKITQCEIPDEYLNVRYILLGPILNEIDLDLIEYLANSTNAKIFLDPQGLTRVIKRGKIEHVCNRDHMRKIAKMVHYIKPNEIESWTITGIKDPFDSVKELVSWGAEVGIVTLAERGSVVYNGEHFYKIPAYKTTAIDPTGAGDVYAGAFIAKMLEGRDILTACLYASAVASIKVEYCGPEFPVTKKEVERRYKVLARKNAEEV